MKVIHNLKPIYDKNSKILILGSMPSIISRNNNFYYANKNNRFWLIINKLYNVNLRTNEEKKEFLIKNNIAMWDVIKSCEINNSDDSSIKNIEVNDIKTIIQNSNIKYIYLNGLKAYQIYIKNFKDIKTLYEYLPSTSSANAKYSFEKLLKEYKSILKN